MRVADAGEAREAGDCGEASGRDRLGYLLSRIDDSPYHYGSQWGEIDAERVLAQTQKKLEGLLRITAPGDVLCIPVLISKDLSSHSGRPIHHQPVFYI